MSKAEKSKKDLELRILIESYLIRSGYNKKELAALLHMSPASFYNKFNNSDKFTFLEIRNLFSIMRLTPTQIATVM